MAHTVRGIYPNIVTLVFSGQRYSLILIKKEILLINLNQKSNDIYDKN
jgi:hypothetical protein